MLMEQEEGLRRLTDEIEHAQTALIAAARSDPHRWWSASELEDESEDGVSLSVFMIALYDLVNQHRFEIDDRLRVRLAA